MKETNNKFETLNYSLLLTFENCDQVEELESLFVSLQSEEKQENNGEG